MESKNKLGFLNLILNLVLIITILSSIAPIIYILGKNNPLSSNIIFQFILGVPFFVCYSIAILNLKKINKSIYIGDPFIKNNVEYFRKIGFCFVIIGIVDAIINYANKEGSYGGIMVTEYGSIKPMLFIYLALSLIAFVMSDIFKMAVEIKNENDLTI